MSARAAAASRTADDEVVHAAELLIIRGKEQGRLSPDDVQQGFPVIEAEPDQLERVFQVFREMGIEVSDKDSDADDADEPDDELINAEAVDTTELNPRRAARSPLRLGGSAVSAAHARRRQVR